MTLDVVAWHDRGSADHQAQCDTYFPLGYRTISLSVYGDPDSLLYAAIMVKDPVPLAEKQRCGLSTVQFQQTFDEMASIGYGPLIVSATGPADNPLFAASWFEIAPIPLTRSALTEVEFIEQNTSAQKSGQILRSFDVYGDPGNLRYAAVWVANSDQLAWYCNGQPQDEAMVQQEADALVSGFARPVFAVETPNLQQVSMFNDSISGEWASRSAMTADDYQSLVDQFWSSGLRPMQVNAKGVGASTRFTATWGSQEGYEPRAWRFSGSTPITAIDDAVTAVLSATRVRGASLAIVEGSRLVYAQGYTFAEADYPTVEPTTTFRQASISKMFCAAAIWQLIEGGFLSLDTLLTNVLTLQPPSGCLATNWNRITIQSLLEMTSGVTQGIFGIDAQISRSLPITAGHLASWLSDQPLANVPGDTKSASYSNAGYMLLGLVVAQLRGTTTFQEAISAYVTTPLGMTHTISVVDDASAQPSGEARYHSRPLETAQSVITTGQPLCALGYGDGNVANGGGASGLSAAAVDVARLIAALIATDDTDLMTHATRTKWLNAAAAANTALSGPAGLAHGYHGFDAIYGTNDAFTGFKGGLLATSCNGVWFTTAGRATVLCWNGLTPQFSGWYPSYPALIDAANQQDWGNVDLFPDYGMSSFTSTTVNKQPRTTTTRHTGPVESTAIPSHMVQPRQSNSPA